MIETYRAAVIQIKNAVLESRHKAAASANATQLSLYYGIGKYVSNNTHTGKWGTGAIESISSQLQKELPGLRGFSASNIKNMRQFYEEWKAFVEPETRLENSGLEDGSFGVEIRQLVTGELEKPDWMAFLGIGFTHHIEIIAKCKELDERWYYILRCSSEFWTVEALKTHIRAADYHHCGKSLNNFAAALLDERRAAQAIYAFKDEYLLDFINIDDESDPELIDERVLSREIVNHISNFIMSMGKGFTFIGKSHRLVVDNEEFFCDLLMFSRELNCLVVIELKTGKFKPAYLGQLSFYLSALDEFEKGSKEAPSIGLLLCREASSTTVELAIQDYNKPMGVATYRTAKDIPEAYKTLTPIVEGVKMLMVETL